MIFQNDHERELYLAELAQLRGVSDAEARKNAEHVVILDRRIRTTEFKRSLTSAGGKENRCRRRRKETIRQAANISELYAACEAECTRRYQSGKIRWIAKDREEQVLRAKRFVAAALLKALGRMETARACGANVSTIDHWTARNARYPVEVMEAQKFAETLKPEWHMVPREDPRKVSAA